MSPLSPDYKQSIVELAETAEVYCRLIDRRQERSLHELVIELDGVLPLLYLRGRNLATAAPPDLFQVEPSSSNDDIDFEELIGGEASGVDSELTDLTEELKLLFSPEDTHYIGVNYSHPLSEEEMPDNEMPDTDVIWHSTGEELAKAYVSLQKGLATYNRGQPQGIDQAGWDWLFGFYSVWGEFVPHLIQETFRLAHATISDEEKSVDL